MPKKKVNLDETPEVVEKPQLEDLVAEAHQAEAEEEAKAAEAERQAQEDKENEVEIDLDAEKEATKQEVREQIEKEVVEPLRKEIIDLKETLAPEEVDDYDKFVQEYTEKNGKGPEWKQVATFLEERAVARVEQKQKEAEEARIAAENEEKQKNQEQLDNNLRVWGQQLADLEGRGLLPKMEKPEEGDPGFDARIKLYGLAQGTWNKEGVEPVTNMYEAFTKFGDQIKTNKQPAGFDAPVSIGQDSGADDGLEESKYSETHWGGQNLEAFIAKQLKKIGVGN